MNHTENLLRNIAINDDYSTNIDVQIITFLSGKGGVGKTTLSANFADIISYSGFPVLIIDLDIFNRGMTVFFEERNNSNVNVMSIFNNIIKNNLDTQNLNEKERDEVFPAPVEIIKARDNKSEKGPMYFISSAAPGVPTHTFLEGVSTQQIEQIFIHMIQYYQQIYNVGCVIIDCGAAPDKLSCTAANISSKVIIVSQADPISFDGALNALHHIRNAFPNFDGDKAWFIINKVSSTKFSYDQLQKFYSIVRILEYIPFEEIVYNSFGELDFIWRLGKSTFTLKIIVAIRKLFLRSAPHLIVEEHRLIPEDFIIDFEQVTVPFVETIAKFVKKIAAIPRNIAYIAFVSTILARIINFTEDSNFYWLTDDKILIGAFFLYVISLILRRSANINSILVQNAKTNSRATILALTKSSFGRFLLKQYGKAQRSMFE